MWFPAVSSTTQFPNFYITGALTLHVDPQHRSVQQFVDDEIIKPLGSDEFYFGPAPFNRENDISSVIKLLPPDVKYVPYTKEYSNMPLENPSLFFEKDFIGSNGLTNAQGLARIYSSLITDLSFGSGEWKKRLLSEATVAEAKNNTPQHELDKVLNITGGTEFSHGGYNLISHFDTEKIKFSQDLSPKVPKIDQFQFFMNILSNQ
ncbi:unnamed protein product [Didymodactylos carnosus]|uniref:Uncharacterized protein n=1 Tax=Didymodactylos carnosus TaxID=1234261 RepID=A0A814XVF3_9BILA|nr:unnamed protein product [Didymodactylos carnosus]CAF1220826.1 unnamed protein product [Didymodactylos carnosus]CAF3833730.1 unnamed protein product [Didymodactylos carnosus]CAF3984155.1 unnamed protein product [Didymodactylos carnosus]